MDSTPRAVMWDFGGVLTASPFDGFARYERDNALPEGFLRTLNATNPDTNAWAALERGEVSLEEFASRYQAEALAAGYRIDAREVLACLEGEPRPEMVEALRRCHERLLTALLTNNFTPDHAPRADWPNYEAVLKHFDVVIESSREGIRKPDPRFYERACLRLGVAPAECVYLDDLGVNLKPARAMGMRTIKVENPAQALSELEALVGFRVTSR